MNGTFSEQLGGVSGVFDQWGTCEKTVVACTLARRVPWPELRLVQHAVEAALKNQVQDERLEIEANDEAVLANLLAGSAEEDDNEGTSRLQRLVRLLPLLRADNARGKEAYVAAAPALVRRCVDAPRSSLAPPLCGQLLCYLLLHPALTPREHRTLTEWLRYLESHISGNRHTDSMWLQRLDTSLPRDNIWGSSNAFRRTIGKNVEFRSIIDTVDHAYTAELQESFSKNGRDVDISLEGEKLNFDAAISQPKQRSNSLTPPSSNFMHMSSSAENLSDEPFQKPRSFSLSSEHSFSQLRPLGGAYTTGSETRLDDLRTNNFSDHPGMSMVGQWLKSLRLHKYVWLFTNISYEQMMAIDDKYLEKLGVTKGARHKLLLSIKKLGERDAIVDSVQAEFLAGATGSKAARCLERLRGVLLSPMPPASPLPFKIVQALDTASKCIAGAGGAGSGAGGGAGSGAGGGAGSGRGADGEHDAVDPLSLHCWLVEKALHQPSFGGGAAAAALRRLRHRLPPHMYYHHVGDTPPHLHKWRMPHNGYSKRHWPPAPRGKAHSYPPSAPPAPPAPRAPRTRPHPPPRLPPHDDYSGLDALCLQMTEQAIN